MRFLVDVTPSGVDKRRRVDVLLRGSRIAVLVHGCFWHCCPQHFSLPKSNREWWLQKFSAIKHRDVDTLRKLEEAGWLSLVVWEHEDMGDVADRLVALHKARKVTGGAP
jgi:DNA mismatch endonuclease (patch repair protein)